LPDGLYSLLADQRVLRIGGADRHEFLQGQLTQDMRRLGPATSVLAGWTTAKGRLAALSQLVSGGDVILMPVAADLADALLARLRLYVLRAKVQIELSALAVAGILEAGPELRLGNLSVPPGPGAAAANHHLALARRIGDPARAIAIGEPDQLRDTLAGAGLAAGDPGAWQLAEIRAGLPAVVGATAESFVPQMVNLDLLDGISFTKGCYVGQEVVARTQHLGRIKRRMYRFRAAAAPALQPGDPVLDAAGDAAGKVVTAAPASGGQELLAVVAIAAANGSLFSPTTAGEGQPLERLPLPYAVETG
jgi:folate-binding protein YgfZ